MPINATRRIEAIRAVGSVKIERTAAVSRPGGAGLSVVCESNIIVVPKKL
nr:hypothetical protein [Altererythrobacter segetis]